MQDLTLARHGQAQTGAKDEASYDNLSDLGQQQARWLGEHIRSSQGYDHVVSGALNRQIQTAQNIGLDAPHHKDARLNEMDYFGLAASLAKTHGVPWPSSEPEFIAHVPKILTAWRKGEISDDLESYEAFCQRISAALMDATQYEGRVLLVTSAGVISTLVAMALDLEVSGKSKIFMSVSHTSLHRFSLREDGMHLTQFAATPHLDHANRLHGVTYA